MNYINEIQILYQIYNTLSLISTKGQDTLYMASSLNALREVVNHLEDSTQTSTITIPIDEIPEEE